MAASIDNGAERLITSLAMAAFIDNGAERLITNRDRYVGAKAIMGTYASLAKYVGDSPILMHQSERAAWAKAWDAYCKTRGRGAFLRGIPGGFFSLAALERLSPRFHAWLDEPCDAYTADPKAELERAFASEDRRPVRLTEEGKARLFDRARDDAAAAYANAREENHG